MVSAIWKQAQELGWPSLAVLTALTELPHLSRVAPP